MTRKSSQVDEPMMVTKAVALVESTEADGDAAGPGTFSLILSAPTEDRDGETLETGALEPLPDHIAMDVDHGMSVTTTVGSGRPFYNDDGALQVDGTFASTGLGQETRTLVREGHIRTASVAFIPQVKTKAVDGKGPRITKGELLNGAFTPVPSNRESVVLSSKSQKAAEQLLAEPSTKAGARNSTSDLEHLQTAHDELVSAGASCDVAATGADADTKAFDRAAGKTRASVKSIVGSVEALQDRVQDALDDAYGEWNTYERGVLVDEGVVIFNFWGYSIDPAMESGESYRQSYTDDGTVVVLSGQPEIVDIHEIVVPDADADRVGKSSSAAPAGSTAAVKAAVDPADQAAADDDAQVVRARTLALRARVAGTPHHIDGQEA